MPVLMPVLMPAVAGDSSTTSVASPSGRDVCSLQFSVAGSRMKKLVIRNDMA